ncbi:tetratricopeptide repeat protein [Lysobacter korlensis]|uniref:Tetratricopeptide repeat protein n=1 Tax=Lysobacter korlensis TaxID=553636 RepID=A0ABV6RQG7_9GAMM
MPAFYAIAAVMVLLTLFAVTRPLWRPRAVVGVGVTATLALGTALLYFAVGTPAALDPAQRKAPETLADAIAQLEAELERNPERAEGWHVLARAYASEGRTQEALRAFAQAIRLAPDADVLAEAAETRARGAADRRFDAEAVAMLRRALELQPAHQRARWFLGIAQRQAGQPAEAARTWEPLLASVDPQTAASLRPQIDAARVDAGLEPLPESPAEPADPGLDIRVSLSPEFAERVPAGAAVFVIARAAGTVMPVAVERLPATAFPITLRLDDSDSPMPAARLSQLDKVEVLARVSASGNASAQPGDFASSPIVVEIGKADPIDLSVDRVVP